MGRRVAASVRVVSPDGQQQIIPAGQELPDWAKDQVTNDAAFLPGGPDEGPVTVEAASEAEGEGGQAFTAAAVQAGAPDYSAMKVAELRDLAEKAGLPTEGTKADLVAALEASA